MVQRIPELTIIIPTRKTAYEFWEDLNNPTMISLGQQTYKDYEIHLIPDQGKGANFARNEGFKNVKSEFVLFCDDDINWKPTALETMMRVLKKYPKASYVYGRYKLGNAIWSHQPWDPLMLKRENYISTMSIIRTKDLPNPPFDESIKRLQDYDLWLTMLDNGKRGIYCEDLIFETEFKPGISHEGMNYVDAMIIVKRKHNL